VCGQASGEISERDEQALARFLVCQIQGMRVLEEPGVLEAESRL
jgi:TetR/AcrR family transcriptional repressor of nem operon